MHLSNVFLLGFKVSTLNDFPTSLSFFDATLGDGVSLAQEISTPVFGQMTKGEARKNLMEYCKRPRSPEVIVSCVVRLVV